MELHPKNASSLESSNIIAKEDNSVYKIIEKMSRYGDCSTLQCSNQAMLDFHNSNLKYPQTAPSRGLEGKVYLEFIIEKDGSFSNVKIVR
ncbi:MAG: outer membrane biosynthesis protein TonB, partial [Saprospiraceae bacterium]